MCLWLNRPHFVRRLVILGCETRSRCPHFGSCCPMCFFVCLRQSKGTEVLGKAKLNGQQHDLYESQIHVGELKAKRWRKGKIHPRTRHEGPEGE